MKPVIHTENEPEVVSRITELLIEQGKTQTELYIGYGDAKVEAGFHHPG